MDHLGFRMKLSTVGFEVSGLKVNGRDYDEARTNEDVTSLSLMHSSGGLDINFPTHYNIGPTNSASGNQTMALTATKTVKIKVHGASQAEQFVFIDYLFESESLGADTYFIYDPTVSEVASGTAPAPAPAAYNWGWTASSDLCGGIITNPDDEISATTVGVGPCEGASTAPTAYLKSSLVGLAFVDEDQYLSCTDASSCSSMKVLHGTQAGYRDTGSNLDGPQAGAWGVAGEDGERALSCLACARFGGE
jgi:hypothetical protein